MAGTSPAMTMLVNPANRLRPKTASARQVTVESNVPPSQPQDRFRVQPCGLPRNDGRARNDGREG
jgi:hypothetical protein